ncbi:MAG TPA: hypothetical protein VFH80_04305 [Solirubrobacteraceae bacterium]|nr:hypothetical protein [Solirubrobacteraceae bacterium]
MERATARLELAIEVDSDPISGSVSNGSRHSQPFIGWIELVVAIEAARSSAALLGGPGGTERQTLGSLPGAKATEL